MRFGRSALLLAALACNGCVTYDRGTLAAVSTTRLPARATVVAENVEGRACGEAFGAPVRRAIEDALGRWPDANALVDVRYSFERLCVVARATAVRVQ